MILIVVFLRFALFQAAALPAPQLPEVRIIIARQSRGVTHTGIFTIMVISGLCRVH